MAAYDFGYDDLRSSGTFKVASATKTAIKSDPRQIVGKVVTITGNYEVGYGSDGKTPLGVVTQFEPEVSGSEDLVVTVTWGQTFENIPCTSGDAAGDYLLCDGKGGLKKISAALPAAAGSAVPVSNCKALGVAGTLATIKID